MTDKKKKYVGYISLSRAPALRIAVLARALAAVGARDVGTAAVT